MAGSNGTNLGRYHHESEEMQTGVERGLRGAEGNEENIISAVIHVDDNALTCIVILCR